MFLTIPLVLFLIVSFNLVSLDGMVFALFAFLTRAIVERINSLKIFDSCIYIYIYIYACFFMDCFFSSCMAFLYI